MHENRTMVIWAAWIGLLWAASAAADPALARAVAQVDAAGIGIERSWIEGRTLHVLLGPTAAGLAGDDQRREDLVRDLLWAARRVHPDLDGIQTWLRRADGSVGLLSEVLADPAEQELVGRLAARAGPRPAPRNLPPDELPFGGSLVGRTIALSPGHGWLWYDSLGDWSFQRGLINMPGCESCQGIIEDVSNAQIAARYVIGHLLRAGGQVWSVRERELSAFERIIDESDPGVTEQGPWSNGASTGGWADDYRVCLSSNACLARFELEPAAEGEFWVSVWTVAGANRISDALVRIHHLGGVTEHHLDQTRNGSRWIHLGRYRFAPGAQGALEILPGPAAEPDRTLVADAVRLGGGVSEASVNGIAADHMRWEMSALYGLAYLGLPAAVDTGSDVTVRPAWAEWQGADLYLSLHSNASGGSTSAASGTSTYRYNCGTYPDHSAAPDPALCDDPPGSDRLQHKVHEAILEFLRAEWDPAWRDRGRLVANFGELRVLDAIPGALVESAFHDGTEPASAEMRMPDNQALQDPRFRYWLGYSIYAGLARYFDDNATLLPARPPEGVSLIHAAGGGLLVQWQPVAGADGYRVRWAVDGLGLGEGWVTDQTSLLLDSLAPGQVAAVRISALNTGGEGPASEWQVARYRGNGTYADALLVTGFDRQDAFVGDGNNRRDQATAHAQAIAALADRNVYFDCASNEAIASGQIALEAYRVVVWILGEESTEDETFDPAEQSALRAYLQGGGALMASGAEIGWDLVERGSVDDELFFDAAFDSLYLADDADTFSAEGSGSFAWVGQTDFDDGRAGIYPVEWPDVLDANSPQAEVVLRYASGAGAAAASARGPGRSVLIGFPFETIVDPAARFALMDACLAFLMPDHTPDDFDSDGLPDDWEHAHDTDPLTPSADADPDGDGRSNAQEYAEGTDPQVPDGSPEADGGSDGGDAIAEPTGCGCASSYAGAAGRTIPLGSVWLLALFLVRRRRSTLGKTP